MASGPKVAMVPMKAGFAGFSIIGFDWEHEIGTANPYLPHRHDYYCCFFASSGQVRFVVDTVVYEVSHPSLMICKPGQIHHIESAKGLKGWMLCFQAKMVDETARQVFEQSNTLSLINLKEAHQWWFSEILESIAQNVSAERFARQTSYSLIDAFFYRAASLLSAQLLHQSTSSVSRPREITQQFQDLVNKNFCEMKNTSSYAELLNISPGYLNDTVQQITGLSASGIIQQSILAEAKRLLAYTPKSIREIAQQLGYQDEKYFSRFFSKKVGMSPSMFKKS